jgi:hypothetical protein
VRKAALASILRKSRPGVRLNEHMEHPEGDVVFRHACKMGIAVPIWSLTGLAEVQEPKRACGVAGSGSDWGRP